MNIDEFPTFSLGRVIPNTRIELRSQQIPTCAIRSVLFDFDGTISLIRAGWQDVMVPMMIDILQPHAPNEERPDLHRLITGFVERLTGKQTIFQMMRLAEEVAKRGGVPLDPLEYKRQYLDALMERIQSRREGLRDGSLIPADMLMPNTRQLLEALRARGIALYLASGTDLQYVREEADLLDVSQYFHGRIYAALDRVEDFSKAQVIQQIFRENSLQGAQLASFGDGYVEILNTKEVGGIAIGVASDEVGRHDVNEWKRNRLIQAGADVIVPGYDDLDDLLRFLFDEEAD